MENLAARPRLPLIYFNIRPFDCEKLSRKLAELLRIVDYKDLGLHCSFSTAAPTGAKRKIHKWPRGGRPPPRRGRTAGPLRAG